MSVERRNGQWRVRYRDERGSNRSRTFAREGAAHVFDERVRELKALGQLHRLDEKPAGVQTVAEWAAHWWETYAEPALGDATLDLYADQLRLRIIPKWGSTQLRDLTAQGIERWAGELPRRGTFVVRRGRMAERGTGQSAIRVTLAVLSSMLTRAERDGEIDRNPIPLVAKPPTAPQRDPVLITPFQVEMMRAWLLEHRTLRDATLVSVLAYSGPRPESEVVGSTSESAPLAWSDVGARGIRYVATKHGRGTRRPRTTKLLAPLAKDLAVWRDHDGVAMLPTAPVFPGGGPDGGWSGDDWDTWRRSTFRPAAAAAGVPAGARPRDLRASFVSLLVYEGWNVAEVARQLGHSVETCATSYLRIFEDFQPADRRPAEDLIREARAKVARGVDQAREAM